MSIRPRYYKKEITEQLEYSVEVFPFIAPPIQTIVGKKKPKRKDGKIKLSKRCFQFPQSGKQIGISCL